MNAKPEATTLSEARDAGYPTYPLDEALKVAKGVYDLGGSRTPVKKEMLAKQLGYAETGPSFVQRIGAAKTFGLIDGRGGYELTDLGKKYFLPASDSDQSEAAVSALQTPPAFAKIYARFHGQKLPSNQILGNIMHTEGKVPASWKDKAASLFIKSAISIGALDSNGNLRASLSAPTGENKDQGGQSTSSSPPRSDFVPPDAVGTHTHVLPLANKRKVSITAPLDVTQAEITRIQKWVEVTLLVEWSSTATPSDA